MNFVKLVCRRLARKREQMPTRETNLQKKINPSTYTATYKSSPSSTLHSNFNSKHTFYRWGNVSRLAGTTEFDNEKHITIGSGLNKINDYPTKQGLAFDREGTVKEVHCQCAF